MYKRLVDSELTRLLQDADPLQEHAGLTAPERLQMRRTVLAQVPTERTGPWRQLVPALSVALLLAVALGLAWRPAAYTPTDPRAAVEPPSSPSSTDSLPGPETRRAKRPGESRRIQFETPGGTTIVWILDPDFPS